MCGRIVKWAVGKVGFVALFSVSIAALSLVFFDWSVPAVSSAIVISQVYGGGGNTGATYKNDFIEIFNLGPTTIDIAGWSVQYTSATSSTWSVTSICPTGSCNIAPGKYFLVQEQPGGSTGANLPTPDATGTINMSATAGKVALVNNTTVLTGSGCPFAASVVDFVGYGTTANCSETSPTAAPSNTTSVLRKTNGCTETDNNNSDFATGTPNPRNSSTTASPCGTTTNPSGVGAANPNEFPVGVTTLLTVSVTPGTFPTSTGISVTGNLSSIGGSASQKFYDDSTHGDTTSGDNIFSFQIMVPTGTTPGAKSLPITIIDAQSRTGSATISLTAQLIAPTTPGIVISQVYGGGGNSGATYKNDFIELFNKTGMSIDVAGWSVQFVSAAGTNWQMTPICPSGPCNIAPGKYFLVQEAQGAGGTTNLPTPDATGTIAMGSSSGKVALVTNTTTLSGSCPSSASIVDFVSYGGSSPTCYEGTAAAATLGNTTAALRNMDGCTDTNQNSTDFTELAPNPRNSASATHICPGVDTSAPAISSKSANPGIISPNGDTIQDSTTISFDITENLSFPVSWTVKIENASSTVVRTLSGSVSANGTVNIGWDGKNDSNVVVPDGTYSTEITATDSSSNAATSDPTIVVDNTAPDNYHNTFTGANFVSGSVVYVKSTTSINVTANDGSGSGIASCTLQIDSGATNAYTLGTNFTIPSPEGSHSFKVTCTDNASNTGIFNQTVIVDDTAPSVTLNAPNGGETIVAGSIFPIMWTLCAESGSGSGLSSTPIALSYSTDGGATFPNVIATGEANDGLYSWNTPSSVDSTAVRVKITCSDNLGNAAMDTSNANFTLAPGAAVTTTKEATNLTTGSTVVFRAGDTIQYTVVLTNTGGLLANNNSGPEFIDQITSPATIVVPNTGATASSGTISYNISTRTYSWDGSIPVGGSVTLTFSMRILSGLIGTIHVCNQGIAFVDTDNNGSSETQVLTVDPTPLSGAPGTQTCVDVIGKSDCFKLACLSVTGLKEVWVERARALRFEALGEDIKEINVQVFSLKGERIYQSGWVENGYEWRMDNGEGRRIANGVYLYVVTVRGYDGKVMQTQIKKLVIAR